jgi:hypothetical protein
VGAAMLAATLALVRLNSLYCRLMGIAERHARPPAWRRPLSNVDEGRLSGGILDVIMVVSVLAATVAIAVWFLFFAECYGGGCLSR